MHILIAGKNSNVLSALEFFITHHNGQKNSVEVASDFEELKEKIEKLSPEVVLLDWDSFSYEIKDVLYFINTTYPLIYVIIISDQKEYKKEAMKMGANEFLLKTDPQDKFVNAINNLRNKRNQL